MQCADLDAALSFYTDDLEFRLDMIFPADSPRVAELSGHGINLRIERDQPDAPTATNEWVTGRAGMQYRDLIPDRLGGKLIASHIRIPTGGPVPDYVHHHGIEFQMIYCYRGWVRVVYEDQGPPFVLEAGDCVLQPPHIRHRVLECSDQMEVIEVGSPAEHETYVEHGLDLPTATLDAARDFGGQQFVRHQATKSEWMLGPYDGFESRDTGIAAATNDLASVLVIRPKGSIENTLIQCESGYVFAFVLQGSINGGQVGDCLIATPGSAIEIAGPSNDLEILLVRSAR